MTAARHTRTARQDDRLPRVSLITSAKPAALSKSVRRGPGGDLEKQGGGVLVEGHVRTRAIADLKEFATLLQGLGPNQALAFGVPSSDLLSRAACDDGQRPADAITRARDHFA